VAGPAGVLVAGREPWLAGGYGLGWERRGDGPGYGAGYRRAASSRPSTGTGCRPG